MKHTFPREFYIPKDARKETQDGINAEVYLYEQRGKPCGMGFIAKQSKHVFNYAYRSEESRREAVSQFFDGQRKAQEYKDNRRAQKRNFVHTLKVGDVLHGSWGYDQTNCEFAEVVELHGKVAVIRSLAHQHASGTGNSMAENVKPVPGNYIGEPMRRIIQEGNYIRYNDHCTMSVTDPNSEHYSSWYA